MDRVISKKKQRVSSSYVIEESGKKYFIKKYMEGYSEELITTEFEKSKKIYEHLKEEKLAKTPKPLGIEKKKRIMKFEYLPNFIEIKKFFLRNNNIFFMNEKAIQEIMAKIVDTVAYLHKNLKLKNPKTFEYAKINDKKIVPLITDLCSSNLLLKGKDIFIIDFSPSQYMFPIESCNIIGSSYFDIVHLIYAYEHPPLLYRPFYRRNFKAIEKFITQRYFKQMNLKYNKKFMNLAKQYYLKRYLSSLNGSLTYWWWSRIIKKELTQLKNEL